MDSSILQFIAVQIRKSYSSYTVFFFYQLTKNDTHF